MPDQPDLTALLGSRICHDLISPIGAIGNGVELMMMTGMPASPEMTLIAESVAAANARIKFFRVAFGQSGDEQRMGTPEVASILNGIAQSARIAVDWQVPGDILRREARLAFLAMQCLETALAFGGRITVLHEGNRWTLTAHAPRLKIDPDLWEALSKPCKRAEITPAVVQFALLPDELQRQARRLLVEICETEVKLSY
jgi:histidine phosphotransferase ChpT